MGKSTIILFLVGLSIQLILAQRPASSKEVSNRKLNPVLEDDEIPMEPLKPSPPTDTKARIEKRQRPWSYGGGGRGFGVANGGRGSNFVRYGNGGKPSRPGFGGSGYW